jgi:hypothetical protein
MHLDAVVTHVIFYYFAALDGLLHIHDTYPRYLMDEALW